MTNKMTNNPIESNDFDWSKVSDNQKVIRLLKDRKIIEDQIQEIDNMALVRYELEVLQLPNEQ